MLEKTWINCYEHIQLRKNKKKTQRSNIHRNFEILLIRNNLDFLKQGQSKLWVSQSFTLQFHFCGPWLCPLRSDTSATCMYTFQKQLPVIVYWESLGIVSHLFQWSNNNHKNLQLDWVFGDHAVLSEHQYVTRVQSLSFIDVMIAEELTYLRFLILHSLY